MELYDSMSTLRAVRRLEAGEGATVPYGASGSNLPNARLLFDYGFCLEANPNDDVSLPLPPPEGGTEAEPRAAVLGRLGLARAHAWGIPCLNLYCKFEDRSFRYLCTVLTIYIY